MKKLVIVKSTGELPIRGGINGPILTPISLDLKDIITLLNNFKEVYECNPYSIGEQIRLTRINCTKENFKEETVSEPIISISSEKIEESDTELLQKNNEMDDETSSVHTDKPVIPEQKIESIIPDTPNIKEPKKEDMKKIDTDFVSNSKRKK